MYLYLNSYIPPAASAVLPGGRHEGVPGGMHPALAAQERVLSCVRTRVRQDHDHVLARWRNEPIKTVLAP